MEIETSKTTEQTSFEKTDYKLDPLGSSVLKYIKSIKGLEKGVLAGGYLRDLVGKKMFKDIDIFLPRQDLGVTNNIIKGLSGDYKYVTGKHETFGHSAYNSLQFYVWDVNNLGEIPIQIIVTTFPERDFLPNLIKSFDFGMCQIFTEDSDIYATENFNYDMKFNIATLLNLDKISRLPNHMKRFFRFEEKYEGLKFNCPALELKKKEKPIWEPTTSST